MKKIVLLIMAIITLGSVFAQMVNYNWPTEDGEALLSDKYKVFVQYGSNPEVELQTLMSNAIYKGDYRADYLKGRTFSFAQISYDEAEGQELTFRVVKAFGNGTQTLAIAPKSYGIEPTVNAEGNEVTFKVNKHTRYISINFKSDDNKINVEQNVWIKHMLTVFVNPPEIEMPDETSAGVVVYSNEVAVSELEAANTIVFKQGYYNLKNYQNPGTFISDQGKITLKGNQKMYLAGGAFVEGNIETSGNNVTIFGRGILSLRQYFWPNSPDYDGYDAGYIIHLQNNSKVQGIMVMEPCWHGIVGQSNNLIENIKFLGWHSNNDGVRVGQGSEIRYSFMRCVDDDFYDFGIYVHDLVLWKGHNGSIMTYGWGSYNSGASVMENIDVINPEWTGLGNNNGLIMSQTQFDYKPYDYGTGSTTTIIRNIYIEGKIPGLTNIKTRENGDTPKVLKKDVGYLGDLILENITVENQFEKGTIRGKKDVASDEYADYYTQNISLEEISIGGVCVTNENKANYFNIDGETTRDLYFKGCNTTGITLNFINPVDGAEIVVGDSLNVAVYASDADGAITGVKLYLNNQLVSEITEEPYVWEGHDLLVDMQVGDYILKAIAIDNDENTWQNEIMLKVIPLPNVQNLSVLVKSSTSLFLQWANNTNNETGYIIERSLAFQDNFIKIDTLEANDTSYLDTELNEFTLYQYRIRTVYETTATQPSEPVLGRTQLSAHAELPDPWKNISFGDTLTAMAGTGTFNENAFTIDAGDGDFWTDIDRGHFIYQPFTGNCEIIAYIDDYYAHEQQWSMAGLMMRDSLNAGSKFAAMMLIAHPGGVLRDRMETNGPVNQSPYPNGGEKAPYWVRLKRIDNTFIGYVSAEGSVWKEIRSVNIPMRETIYVGMAATTHTTESNGIYSFKNVSVSVPLNEYIISASAETGGKINPSGDIKVLEGSNLTYTFLPNEKFAVSDVIVDTESKGKIATYTFENISTNHTINVAFEQVSFTILATAGAHGSITPEGELLLEKGASQTYIFTSDAGYEIDKILVDDVLQDKTDSYTFDAIENDHKINVSFILIDKVASVLQSECIIFPNPVKNRLNVTNESIIENIQVIDLSGKVCLNKQTNSKQVEIDLSRLTSNIYLLKIVSSDGISQTKRFVKTE